MIDTKILEGQVAMEAHLEKTLYENNVQQKDIVNGLMRSSGGECSFADKTLTLEFPIQDWQTNRVGNLHGGIMCTAFDITIAALTRFFTGENFAPTISLDVKFLRPAAVGETIRVTARATFTGRRITQLTGEAYNKESRKLIATAASVYLNADTTK